MIHISKDGTGDFKSIGEALRSLPSDHTKEQVLYIHKGFYEEQITVMVPHVTFVGEDTESTILSYGLYARMTMEDGMKRGTFRTYSCLIDTHDFTAKNLTFENSAGIGTDVGQALALYADGDRLFFENCRFLGNQDTLFTGPLPPKEIEPNGFIGPKQHSPRINGRHYYKNCYLEGDIDFIFGSATAYFEGCTFFSKYTGMEISSYVTAASTPKGQEYGYVMENCRFESNCPSDNAYLGRPWREYGKTVLINCFLDDHICKEGWHDWNKEAAHEHTFFGEYGSYGPGAVMEKRPDWIHRLTETDLKRFSKEAVLSGSDNWNP
ncbi:MAG: pectinesterase family protein [Lacrimispora sphenoides]